MASYNNHARSNSFPSAKHPLDSEFDEQLSRLRYSQETSSSSKLNGLQDLHDCFDRLLLLPLNQQALSKLEYSNENLVDKLLNGSLRVLDLCDTAKDALTRTKASTQELLSIIRRRRGADLSIEVKRFLASRKMTKKVLQKVMENRANYLSHKKQENGETIFGILRETESITLTIFESLISFVSGTNSQPKPSGWSQVISKLVNSNKVACVEVNEANEFAMVDGALKSHISNKKLNSTLEESAQKDLQKLEVRVRDLEQGLESLYRSLVKSRVSLLNILNH